MTKADNFFARCDRTASYIVKESHEHARLFIILLIFLLQTFLLVIVFILKNYNKAKNLTYQTITKKTIMSRHHILYIYVRHRHE